MNKYEIVQRIEEFAPLETQEKWDSSGWIVDLPDKDVSKIMFALTITETVYNQALDQECDMIISHHPLFFVPFGYKKINMYCAHTNLDRAEGGTTDLIIAKLGLKKSRNEDFVRIVELNAPIRVDFLKNKLLEISPNLRYVNNYNRETIQTIGFCAGSGSEFISATKTDAFVTGDLKFHTALEASPVVFDIGHFESEIFAPALLREIALGIKSNDVLQAPDRRALVFEKVKEVDNSIEKIIGVLADEKSPFI